jgi:hypothetical protein
MSPRVKKIARWTALGFAVLFLVIQFFRPDRSNPPVDPGHALEAVSTVPPDVSSVLKRSCYDCHSSETDWPWYSNVAPFSWFVADHVHDGRRVLNFSEFATYSPRRQSRALREACEQVEEGEMPLSSYTLIHRSAKLATADRTLLCDWAKRESDRLRTTAPAAAPGDRRPSTGDGSGTGHGDDRSHE